MKTSTIVWTVILVLAGIYLAVRAFSGDMARVYVERVDREYVNVAAAGEKPDWVEVHSEDAAGYDFSDLSRFPLEERIGWTQYETATPKQWAEATAENPQQQTFVLSMPRTIGIWVAAFFTLAIFSFLYRDNPFYKIAEAVVVGVSAAYWMVVGFWQIIVPNLIGKLSPDLIQSWAMPGLREEANFWYLVPLVLGVMLLWRLMPVGAWISRWPLAFFIGVFCGLRLIAYMHGNFLNQIRNALEPVIVVGDTGFDFWLSLRHFFLVGGVLTCLVYFFFSVEHKGIVGKTAKVGIWVLMITFGAGFGYTVMGRIALLAIRLEFLFDDWLWWIDQSGRREGLAQAAAALGLA